MRRQRSGLQREGDGEDGDAGEEQVAAIEDGAHRLDGLSEQSQQELDVIGQNGRITS